MPTCGVAMIEFSLKTFSSFGYRVRILTEIGKKSTGFSGGKVPATENSTDWTSLTSTFVRVSLSIGVRFSLPDLA